MHFISIFSYNNMCLYAVNQIPQCESNLPIFFHVLKHMRPPFVM